jgi:anti-sigma factor RsiW
VLREQLTLYAEGLLEAGEKARVETHLEACEACRAVLEGIRDTRKLLRLAASVELPAGLVEETAERIRLARSARPGPRQASIRPLVPRLRALSRNPAVVGLAAAAAAALLVAVLWGLGTFNRGGTHPAAGPLSAEQDVDFYLQEHALSADQGMYAGDNFSWLVVASDLGKQK